MRCFTRLLAGVSLFTLAVPAGAAPAIAFDPPRLLTLPAPAELGSLFSGDWNGDGKTDLAALSGRTLWIFAGDGAGGFQSVLELPLGFTPQQIDAVDLNSDGRTDLLVYHCSSEFPACVPSGDFSAVLSAGDVHFASPIRFRPPVSTAQGPPGGPYVLGFRVADFNRDGKPDLILILNPPGRDSVLLGRGDGTFTDPLRGPRTFFLAGLADFNSDGALDVVTNDYNGPLIYFGRGDNNFNEPRSLDVCTKGAGSCYLQVADIDGDGAPDLLAMDIVWTWAGNIRLLRGNGRGEFELLAKLPDSLAGDDRQGFLFSFVDLNADKIPDLVRVRDWYNNDGTDNRIGFYLGAGAGEFPLSAEVRLPYRGASLVVDVNGDGKPDVVATDGGRSLSVFLNASGREAR
jgi:hypothetical protein